MLAILLCKKNKWSTEETFFCSTKIFKDDKEQDSVLFLCKMTEWNGLDALQLPWRGTTCSDVSYITNNSSAVLWAKLHLLYIRTLEPWLNVMVSGDGSFGGSLGWMRWWGWDLQERTGAPPRRDPSKLGLRPSCVGMRSEGGCLQARKEPSLEPYCVGILTVGFQPLELWGNKFPLINPLSVWYFVMAAMVD